MRAVVEVTGRVVRVGQGGAVPEQRVAVAPLGAAVGDDRHLGVVAAGRHLEPGHRHGGVGAVRLHDVEAVEDRQVARRVAGQRVEDHHRPTRVERIVFDVVERDGIDRPQPIGTRAVRFHDGGDVSRRLVEIPPGGCIPRGRIGRDRVRESTCPRAIEQGRTPAGGRGSGRAPVQTRVGQRSPRRDTEDRRRARGGSGYGRARGRAAAVVGAPKYVRRSVAGAAATGADRSDHRRGRLRTAVLPEGVANEDEVAGLIGLIAKRDRLSRGDRD